MKSILSSALMLGIACGAHAQTTETPPPAEAEADASAMPALIGDADPTIDTSAVAGEPEIASDTEASIGADTGTLEVSPETLTFDESQATEPGTDTPPTEGDIDMTSDDAQNGRFTELLKSLRVSLKHEVSYKFDDPRRVVNNRSSVRLEYSKLFADKYYVRLDTKLNAHWGNDHRAKAEDKSVLFDSITREAFLQSSFGETSVRLGYQILPWGVSEGGAITDEVSPRNSSEFFFVSLEESRIGQPMLTVDQFSSFGEWSAFFVPRPAYNEYPKAGTEYDIPDAFVTPKPEQHWSDAGDFEYGFRWKRTFGKSDFSLMAASLIDNDYLIRKQRFQMYGLTANIARGNMLYKAEIALKRPKVFFAQATPADPISIVESDQLDASLGFDYSPGGRTLMFSGELIRSRLLDWNGAILGREQNSDSVVASVTNQFFNNDLTLTWLTIYSKPYTTFQHKFLSSYLIDDNSTVYFELFYPDERDDRSGSWAYRDQKQFVIRYQYQF